MRSDINPLLTKGRVREGKYKTDDFDGHNGCYTVEHNGAMLRMIAATAEWRESEGWEHVSVSLEDRCPTWAEMCFVKDLFWKEDEMAVQFHPPKSEHINCHPFCLHLWRNTRQHIRLPPAVLV